MSDNTSSGYYNRHIFFCLNERPNGEDCCAAGPVAVVYPEGTWYTFVDESDIDEIVESHLKNGQVVERLLVPPELGR